MNHFTKVEDTKDIEHWLKDAELFQQDPSAFEAYGKGKTLGLIFFNPSLRTRLSSQKAGMLLGMHVIVMNIGTEGWKLEFEDGTIMNEGKAEHIKDAAAVMGAYCDVIGIRAFASLTDKIADYEERVLTAFQTFAGVPIISLESATRHPLQSLADVISIRQHTTKKRPKVVLTWAPHPKALPQAVANSFIEWMQVANYEFIITHPEGYELADQFVKNTPIVYNQKEAFTQADFIYAKNWSAYHAYGQVLSQDLAWTIDADKMALTNHAKFMHCLPVRRNVVVTDEVIDSPQSIILTQAKNRVVSAAVALKHCLS